MMLVTWNKIDIQVQMGWFHCAVFAKSPKSILYCKSHEPYKVFLVIIWKLFLLGFNMLKLFEDVFKLFVLVEYFTLTKM